tara:strand:- start:2547 stop:2693 length:147 start_codon:yes stop_codon:yes gene_type:complete
MKKLIMIIFTIGLLNSCTNMSDKSNALKGKFEDGLGKFKASINNPLKK